MAAGGGWLVFVMALSLKKVSICFVLFFIKGILFFSGILVNP